MMYKVLLVDDEPPALEGLKLVVNWGKLGYQICGACDNGEEAVDLIEKIAPDLVITDIRMPGLDGLSLIKRVKERIPNIPKFVIVSGYGEFDYARKAVRFGIRHYLLKPIFSEELTEVLVDIRAALKTPSPPQTAGPWFSPTPSSEAALMVSPSTALGVTLPLERALKGSSSTDRGAILREVEPSGVMEVESKTSIRNSGSLYDEIAYLNTIIEALDDLDLERVETTIELAFNYFAAVGPPPEILKMYVINIIYHSIGLINEMNGAPAELPGKYNLSHLDEKKTTPQELKEVLKSYCAECCAYLKSLKDRDSQMNIYKIEAYLRENFQRNLTLKEIARNFYMHPAYVGQLFMKKFGISFNEYLHKMRIEEAKRLMDSDDLKTYEIAMEVGYNNYHGFLQNFEKYAGVKPAEYRKCKG